MPHTILLAHGMGTPTDKMFADWTNELAKLYRKCVAPSMGNFATQIRVIPVNYDKVFQNMRNLWNTQIAGLFTALPVSEQEGLSAADLSGITTDNFFTTHLMDVILYRFFRDVRELVRLTVGEAILKAIVYETPPGGKVSIIAHSLGTAVVHDTLNALFHAKMKIPDAQGGGFFRQLGAKEIHALVQIANVSRTLETDFDAYAPAVRPGKSAANAVAAHMLSASHAWDPLVSVKRFRPDEGWPDEETWRTGRFKLVESGRITHWNVHAFEHYLRDPFVFLPVFRFLFPYGMVDAAKQRTLRREYIESSPVEKFDRERNAMKKLMKGEADFSWKTLIAVFKGFAEAAQEFTK